MPLKVYITRKIPQPGIDLLRQHKYDVEIYKHDNPIPSDLLKEKIVNADALISLLTDPILSDIMEYGKKLKIIANYAVGYNNIDLEFATKSKIAVTNTPGVLTDATAELTWALIMSLSKRIIESDNFTRNGDFNGWGPMLMLGSELNGRTLGIIGAGRIGTAVAKRSIGFNMKVWYSNSGKNAELENLVNGKKVNLDELLSESDFISIHVPLTDKTFHMIDAAELSKMKKSAYLINTSRGPVINEIALVDALKNKQIAGAGLDVYENEPEISRELLKLNNVILLPHIGSATLETRTKMAEMVAENIISFFKGTPPPNILNPEVL